jgi:hypothetical protein
MEAKEERIRQDVAHRRKDGLPATKRELDDRLEVVVLELADRDLVVCHVVL